MNIKDKLNISIILFDWLIHSSISQMLAVRRPIICNKARSKSFKLLTPPDQYSALEAFCLTQSVFVLQSKSCCFHNSTFSVIFSPSVTSWLQHTRPTPVGGRLFITYVCLPDITDTADTETPRPALVLCHKSLRALLEEQNIKITFILPKQPQEQDSL